MKRENWKLSKIQIRTIYYLVEKLERHTDLIWEYHRGKNSIIGDFEGKDITIKIDNGIWKVGTSYLPFDDIRTKKGDVVGDVLELKLQLEEKYHGE